ncbi:3'-5' exonuclease [Paracoccus methylarcula]|uniref:DNA-directed DNA polymerase n=1 Tax=Paracoccus methylarcula TaxID=72022 RepID=A0A3R7LN87_9RHOB|nr:3'-5' exonuclease [Paracoccus methylarcula]RNF33163.1 3'-5' exonuclease [Paracoccus methylarcula]
MKRRVNLRLRVLLVFAGLAFAVLAVIGLALWVEGRRLLGNGVAPSEALDPLLQAGVIAGFGVLALIAAIWFLFDRHFARPIDGLAGALRIGRIPDAGQARYLGDLGPAARDAAEARARNAEALSEAVADHAAELIREKARLESILSDFGAAAVMTDPGGRVVFYNASAARLLPGLALDRPIERHIAPGAIEAANARLTAGAEATDLACLTPDGLRLSGRMRRIEEDILLILRDRAPNRPLPHDVLETLRRHAATLVPMLDALDGPIPPALAQAIRDEGQGLARATRQLSETLAGDAPTARAGLNELVAGLEQAGDPPSLSVLAEAGSMNALLRRLDARLRDGGAQPVLRIHREDRAELHLRLEWQGEAVPMDRLERWLDEAPDPGQPDLSGAEILAAHGSGIWPETGDSGPRLVLPLQLAADRHDAPGLTYDFALAARGAASSRLADLTCVVFDTETTGLEPSDRIVQIAGLRIARGRLTGERFETLVDPGRPIPPGASAVHGITDRMVADAPGMRGALTAFHHFAEDAVLVAHNAPFDMGMLRAAEPETGLHFDHRVLDTVLLSAMVWGGGVAHTLDALAERLDIVIPPDRRHSAMGDATATAEIFLRLIPALEAKGITRFEEVTAEARRHRRLIADANQRSISGASGSRGTTDSG